jgi:hypothetical protein
MIRLTVERDGNRVAVYEFDRDEVLVGRVPPADVILEGDAVSRRHARLQRKNGEWRVSDLGAANGTFLQDGEDRPPDRVIVEPLASGAILHVDTYRVRFQEVAGTPAKEGLVEGTPAKSWLEEDNPTALLSMGEVRSSTVRLPAVPPPPEPVEPEKALDAALALSMGETVSTWTRDLPPGTPMRPGLDVYRPGQSVPERVVVGSAPVQFGSDPTCDVRMAGVTVPRFVAAVEWAGRHVTLRRLAKGLFAPKLAVNGEPVREHTELAVGQRFQVGDLWCQVRPEGPSDR